METVSNLHSVNHACALNETWKNSKHLWQGWKSFLHGLVFLSICVQYFKLDVVSMASLFNFIPNDRII